MFETYDRKQKLISVIEEAMLDVTRWEIVPMSEDVVVYFNRDNTTVIRDKTNGVILEVYGNEVLYKGIGLWISANNLIASLRTGIDNGVLFELEEFYKEN